MTDQIIYRKKYDTNDIKMIHESEVWRYAGYKGTPGPEESRLLSMLEQVKEEIDKEKPKKSRLQNCLKLIAPMITIANGIPVLATNLQKLHDIIIQYIINL